MKDNNVDTAVDTVVGYIEDLENRNDELEDKVQELETMLEQAEDELNDIKSRFEID